MFSPQKTFARIVIPVLASLTSSALTYALLYASNKLANNNSRNSSKNKNKYADDVVKQRQQTATTTEQDAPMSSMEQDICTIAKSRSISCSCCMETVAGAGSGYYFCDRNLPERSKEESWNYNVLCRECYFYNFNAKSLTNVDTNIAISAARRRDVIKTTRTGALVLQQTAGSNSKATATASSYGLDGEVTDKDEEANILRTWEHDRQVAYSNQLKQKLRDEKRWFLKGNFALTEDDMFNEFMQVMKSKYVALKVSEKEQELYYLECLLTTLEQLVLLKTSTYSTLKNEYFLDIEFEEWIAQGSASMDLLEEKLYGRLFKALEQEPPSSTFKTKSIPSLGIEFGMPENWKCTPLIGAALLDKVFICTYIFCVGLVSFFLALNFVQFFLKLNAPKFAN